jgi:hypothetical protein
VTFRETGSSKVFGRVQGLPPSAHGWTMPQPHPNYRLSRLSISNENYHKIYASIKPNDKVCSFRASGHVNMADRTLRIQGLDGILGYHAKFTPCRNHPSYSYLGSEYWLFWGCMAPTYDCRNLPCQGSMSRLHVPFIWNSSSTRLPSAFKCWSPP